MGTRGELFILSAPSGAGKTTLIQGVLDSEAAGAGQVAFAVSHTTRRPRQGEVDGRDYHFVDRPAFREMVASGRFLEWAEVYGNLYGTARDEVLPRLERGIDVVLDIDVQGAEQVLASCPRAHSIFVIPPSYRDLERRLIQRGLDDPQEIARRLAAAAEEMRRANRYEYVIINDDACRAREALAAILLEKRHRLERLKQRVDDVLSDFEAARGRP